MCFKQLKLAASLEKDAYYDTEVCHPSRGVTPTGIRADSTIPVGSLHTTSMPVKVLTLMYYLNRFSKFTAHSG